MARIPPLTASLTWRRTAVRFETPPQRLELPLPATRTDGRALATACISLILPYGSTMRLQDVMFAARGH